MFTLFVLAIAEALAPWGLTLDSLKAFTTLLVILFGKASFEIIAIASFALNVTVTFPVICSPLLRHELK